MNEERLKSIVQDLKNPRPFIRNKAIESLMSINEAGVIPALFKMVAKETDFVKVQFCRFLAKIKGDSAIPPLIIFLVEKSDAVAREAAYSLDEIESERKNNAFMLLLRRKVSHFSRVFAIKSLGQERVNRAVPHLIDLLGSQEEDIKELSIEALRQIGDPAAIHALLKVLSEDNDRAVYLTILTLGEIGEPKTAENIFPFLQHKNENVRRATVWALTKLNYKRAASKLIALLKSDPSELVREEIAKRLGKVAGVEAVKPLIFSKAFDQAHNVKIYAGWALRDIPVKERESILSKLVHQKDEALRGQVLLEIGRTGDNRFFKILKNALKKDKSEYVRACAAEGLSFINHTQVKQLLREALADDEAVSRRSADSLFRFAGPEDTELALDILKGSLNQDPYTRSIGAKIIEKIYLEEEIPENILKELYSLVEAQEEVVQRAIIKALGKVGDKSTISFLKEFQKSKSNDELISEIVKAIDSIERKNISQ